MVNMAGHCAGSAPPRFFAKSLREAVDRVLAGASLYIRRSIILADPVCHMRFFMPAILPRLTEVESPSIGLGCMNLSHGYGQPVPEPEAQRALEEAFEMGYRHFDTATLYGATANERRSEEHTSELQSRGHLVCRLL